MPESNKEKTISVKQAARECGRNMETVRRWIWAGKLPAEKLGNQLFIKRDDLTTFCRETAVKYRAEPEADFLEQAADISKQMQTGGAKPFDTAEEIREMRQERMNNIEPSFFKGGTNMKPGSRSNLIKRMRKLREEIHARTGKVFDAETVIRELRDERDREVR